MIFTAVFSPSIFTTFFFFFFFESESENVLNMWLAGSWISQVGSTKEHFLPLLGLLLFTILKNDYLSSRIIFPLVLTKKKKNTHFTIEREPKAFSSCQSVSKLIITPGTLSILPTGSRAGITWESYCLGVKILSKQNWQIHQINRTVKWVQYS